MNRCTPQIRIPNRASIGKAALVTAIASIAALTSDITLDTRVVVADASAVIGRPATPLSYAGVARRTTRRMIYATSVYVATLPPNCTTIVIEGVALQQCGSTYYQASGAQYVVVEVQ
jgi:hypothetical protein